MDSIIAINLLSQFFKIWKNNKKQISRTPSHAGLRSKAIRERIRFEEYRQEDLDEIEYARVIGDMDSIHWCWNCKYSECDRH